jgi:beta-glucanase (GH16 family)
MLPGSNNVAGLWPAVWAMGNLGTSDHVFDMQIYNEEHECIGRAGYGASLEGMVCSIVVSRF